jgi:hypothetical protein
MILIYDTVSGHRIAQLLTLSVAIVRADDTAGRSVSDSTVIVPFCQTQDAIERAQAISVEYVTNYDTDYFLSPEEFKRVRSDWLNFTRPIPQWWQEGRCKAKFFRPSGQFLRRHVPSIRAARKPPLPANIRAVRSFVKAQLSSTRRIATRLTWNPNF